MVAGAEVVVRIKGAGLGAESSADQRTARVGDESGSPIHFPGRPAPLTRSGGAGRSGNTFVLAVGSRREAPETRPDPGLLSERGPGMASRDDGGEARAEDGGSGATGVRSPHLGPEKWTGSPAIRSSKKMAHEERALPARARPGSTMTSPARQNRHHGTCELVKSPDSRPARATGPSSVPVPLWRAALHTAGAPDSSPAIQRGHAGRRMERRSPDRHRETDLTGAALWSAGLQTGTGDRTKLGTCAALESGAPYCRRAGLQSGKSPRALGRSAELESGAPARRRAGRVGDCRRTGLKLPNWSSARRQVRRAGDAQAGSAPRQAGIEGNAVLARSA